MGREVRMVPPDWRHPQERTARGCVFNKPLLSGDVTALQAEWDAGKVKWDEGLRDDYKGGWTAREGTELAHDYIKWCGDRPKAEDYMPQWTEAEKTHYMMYENVTEGTPISPAFATIEELARWLADTNASACANQGASYEAWLRVCKGSYAPSMVVTDGRLASGVEGLADSSCAPAVSHLDPEDILPSIY